jgi:hypothetical protein
MQVMSKLYAYTLYWSYSRNETLSRLIPARGEIMHLGIGYRDHSLPLIQCFAIAFRFKT